MTEERAKLLERVAAIVLEGETLIHDPKDAAKCQSVLARAFGHAYQAHKLAPPPEPPAGVQL